MKTSNQLIIFLLILTFVAIVSTNLVLKKEYDKIDKSDPFYGYFEQKLPRFSAVKLRGYFGQTVQLQPAKEYSMKVNGDWKNAIKWAVKNDTLELYFQTDTDWFLPGDVFSHPPVAYLTAPRLTAVEVKSVTAKLKGWTVSSWALKQEGLRGGMLLINNTIDSLSAQVHGSGLLQVGRTNQVNQANVLVSDSSRFVAEKDIFQALKFNADSAAKVQLPGSMWHKLNRQL